MNFLKSHVPLAILTLLLTAILSQQALEKQSCFEINVSKEIKIKAGNCIEK